MARNNPVEPTSSVAVSATQLSGLLEKVRAAEGPRREMDAEIAAAFGIVDFERYELADGYVYIIKVGADPATVEAWADCGDGRPHRQAIRKPIAYTSSIDAALALVKEQFPGVRIEIYLPIDCQPFVNLGDNDSEYCATPALALLAALLQAIGALRSAEHGTTEGPANG